MRSPPAICCPVGVCYDEAIDRMSPLLDRRPPKPRFPNRVLFTWNRGSGSIRRGCALDTGRCRDMRRRNPRSGRILYCSCAAAAVHRGPVADQHASRLARGDPFRRRFAGSARVFWFRCGRAGEVQNHGRPVINVVPSLLDRPLGYAKFFGSLPEDKSCASRRAMNRTNSPLVGGQGQ